MSRRADEGEFYKDRDRRAREERADAIRRKELRDKPVEPVEVTLDGFASK